MKATWAAEWVMRLRRKGARDAAEGKGEGAGRLLSQVYLVAGGERGGGERGGAVGLGGLG